MLWFPFEGDTDDDDDDDLNNLFDRKYDSGVVVQWSIIMCDWEIRSQSYVIPHP